MRVAGSIDAAFAWNGRIGRRTLVAGPGGIETGSCAVASQCVAVGDPDIASLAKSWNGKTWHVINTIGP